MLILIKEERKERDKVNERNFISSLNLEVFPPPQKKQSTEKGIRSKWCGFLCSPGGGAVFPSPLLGLCMEMDFLSLSLRLCERYLLLGLDLT